MLENEVITLVRKVTEDKKETQTIETKAAHSGFPRIYDTLSSFSNQTEGGTIIFGIDENQDFEIVGTYKNDIQDLQHRISEACKQMEPEVRAVITSAEIDGKTIVAAEIPGVEFAKRPVYYKGSGIMNGSYIRVGDADEPMNEYEIYRYEAYRRRIRDDIRTVPGTSFDLLNPELVQQYLLALKLNRTNIRNMSNDEILNLMNIRRDGLPTLSAIMSFSKYPQATFPQFCVTAVLVPGTNMGEITTDGKRFLDNKRIEGTIKEMVDGAVNFVAVNMKEQVKFDSKGNRIDVPEYPLEAVREVILNALVHRDYSVYTEGIPVRMEMYRDRLEISNPGGLFGMVTVDTLGRVQSDTRNPALISLLELMHIVENRFSGIPTIRRLMSEAALPEPVFKDEKGMFTVVLYNAEHSAADISLNAIQRKILEFCRMPRGRAEIAEFTGKTQYYVMKTYVEPLVQHGFLAYTKPETPKSPNQKYYTVP